MYLANTGLTLIPFIKNKIVIDLDLQSDNYTEVVEYRLTAPNLDDVIDSILNTGLPTQVAKNDSTVLSRSVGVFGGLSLATSSPYLINLHNDIILARPLGEPNVQKEIDLYGNIRDHVSERSIEIPPIKGIFGETTE